MITPKVSVIVPGHNASGTLKASLASLRSQDWPKDCLEIIYVDDASTDEAEDIASEWADRVVRLTGHPKGPAAARNAGVRQASSQILVFLDADVLAPPQTIRALVGPLMEDGNLDAIFGSYDSAPLDPSLVSQYRNLLHHFVHQTSRRNAVTFWAGCGAVRRQSFETAGGFEEEKSPGAIEDIELGHRMRALGMQIRLQPSIQVKHLKKWTLLRMVHTDIFLRGIPWMRLLFKENRMPGELGDLNLKLSSFLSVSLVWLSACFLLLSFWFPRFIYVVFSALGLVLVMNLAIYRFFRRIRGLRFALMVIPLHMLYYFCSGASVIGSLLYRCLIDRPLPGLESIGAKLQKQYWRRLGMRREREKKARLRRE